MIKRLFLLLVLLTIGVRCYALDDISAKAYVLMEESTGSVILSKHKDVRMKPASTTKIITALCAAENAKLTDVVTVSHNASNQEGSSMYLSEGDKISLENLLYGLMLNSGNDAAVAIAEHIGGSVENFSNIMNNKAKDLGAFNSNFENPNGLDSDNHYVTAYDLGLITCYALKNKTFLDVVKTKSKVVTTKQGVKKYLSNHNKMLHLYEGCVGVKTGFTKKSGRTLVTAAKREGIGLVAVTLSAPNDWHDHKKLLDKGFELVSKEKILSNNDKVENVQVKNGTSDFVGVRCKEEFFGVKIKNQNFDYDVIYKYKKLRAPVLEGETAGEAYVYLNGREIFKTELITTGSVEKKKRKFFEFIKRIFKQW